MPPAGEPPENDTLAGPKSLAPLTCAGKTSLHGLANGIEVPLPETQWDFVSENFSPEGDFPDEEDAPGSVGSRPTFTPVSRNLWCADTYAFAVWMATSHFRQSKARSSRQKKNPAAS